MASVYTPRPTERQLEDAGTDYEDWLRAYLSLFVPVAEADGDPDTAVIPSRVSWPAWGTRGGPRIEQLGEPEAPAGGCCARASSRARGRSRVS